ncbi:MAG: polyprenyl synthetase family protein [Candidatus Promineifilaceae bacterium]|nr:polyprenyl synthetase family protein [Candidatus Promineifilaceae bacterium]
MGMDLIREGLAAIDEHLIAVVNSDVAVLYDASRHILTSGGKRIRPQMALLAYLAAGGEDFDEVVPIATAVEMVHTATLVHDDINDHSLTRRGKATVHTVWGRTFALLTGDYLFTKVYELMAPYGPDYNIIMANACSRLVEGETLQAAAAKAGTIDRETYKQIISLKTASLFEAAANMGARLATDDETIIDNLSRYAYNLGLTFQIVDDILDIVGDPDEMGKPVGTDILQGRGVLAAQKGYKAVDGDGTTAAIAEPVTQDTVDPIQKMMSSLRESGAVEVARLQAEEMGRRARAALKPIPPSPARTELLNLVDTVLDRHN